MIKTAVANVVSPTITADNPHAFTAQILTQAQQAARIVGIQSLQPGIEFIHAPPLLVDSCFIRLLRLQYGTD